MQHRTHSTIDSTRDFLTYGAIGLELDRATERLEQDWSEAAHIVPASSLGAARRRLGAWLIGLGEHVAGAPATMPATR